VAFEGVFVKDLTKRVIACRCGGVELTLTGEPFMVNICHCDDCQRASAELERLPDGAKILDGFGGTGYVLYRKDRVRVTKGADKLTDHRIEGEANTHRTVALCCWSPLYLDFEPGHWVSLFRQRFTDPVPAIQRRINTRFIPAGPRPDDGLPQAKGFPLVMIAKLIGTKIAMGKWKGWSTESAEEKRKNAKKEENQE
jgi:hypothetical protein